MPIVFIAMALQAAAPDQTGAPEFPATACITEAQLAVYMRSAARYGAQFLDREITDHGKSMMCDGRSIATYTTVLRQGHPEGKLPTAVPPAVVAPKAMPDMATFGSTNAPFEMRFDQIRGRAMLDLTINGLGMIEVCRGVFAKSGVTDTALKLSQASCRALYSYGQFSPPLAADRKPTIGQMRYVIDWQPTPYPPAVQPPRPRSNPGEWVTADDYPPDALAAHQAGRVQMQLVVGPDGRPKRCEITSSSGFPALDTAACRILSRRSRFTPAMDATGQSTVGYFEKTVAWQ